jgi:hypothetical protein
MCKRKNPRRQRTIDSVACFVALMHALERGELNKAAESRAELARLGVMVQVVRYDSSAKGGQSE